MSDDRITSGKALPFGVETRVLLWSHWRKVVFSHTYAIHTKVMKVLSALNRTIEKFIGPSVSSCNARAIIETSIPRLSEGPTLPLPTVVSESDSIPKRGQLFAIHSFQALDRVTSFATGRKWITIVGQVVVMASAKTTPLQLSMAPINGAFLRPKEPIQRVTEAPPVSIVQVAPTSCDSRLYTIRNRALHSDKSPYRVLVYE